MARYALIDDAGIVVNLIEVNPEAISEGAWSPPQGHSVVPSPTSAGDDLYIGDTVDPETGLLESRAPLPPSLPRAKIRIYGDDKKRAKYQFDAGDTVNIKVTFPAEVTDRTIAVPVDRLNASNEVIEPAALWLKLVVTRRRGRISKVFKNPGRYGVGKRTSKEFEVPETTITIFA